MSTFPNIYTNAPSYWPKLEFSLFLIGQILSIPCYLFVFYHILCDRTARQSLHNHSIFILLTYNFLIVVIDLSLTQDYTRLGYISLFHPAVCLIWQFTDFGIWYGGISMMLWISIERHVLVFHPHFLRTVRGRIFIHYIPLFISAVYTPGLYFVLIFIIPCNRVYSMRTIRCGRNCYTNVIADWFVLYDTITNYIVPVILIAVFSGALFIRFLRQKQRLSRSVTWRQCRKMLLQLLFVSLTYLIFDLPYVIITIVRRTGYPSFANRIITPFITRLTLVPSIILPYAILLALPELKQKLSDLRFWKRDRRV